MTDRTTHRTTDGPAPLLVLDGEGVTSRPERRGYGHPWLTLVAVSFGLMMVGLDNSIDSGATPPPRLAARSCVRRSARKRA